MKKYSRQRELVLKSLKNRIDHPTAETLYIDLKRQMPEIGIATVYRNLTELYEAGEILKIKSKVGPDRYDGNPEPHVHFECDACHEMYDIEMNESQDKRINNEIARLSESIDAETISIAIGISGLCKKCKVLTRLNKN